MSPEERAERLASAVRVKQRGNDLHREERYAEAAAEYSRALVLCPLRERERSIIYANRSACHIKLVSVCVERVCVCVCGCAHCGLAKRLRVMPAAH